MKELFGRLLQNKILKSSLGLLTITFSVKVFGYAEKLVLANYFGTSYHVDVYTTVLTIILSIFFFFREIVEPGFLNVFLDARNNKNETVSWQLFNKGWRIILFMTLIICLFSIFFPGIIAKIFSPGFEGEKLMLTEKLVQIAMPACIFLTITTLTSITLNGLKIFILPASGELVFKGLIIFCMVVFYKESGIIGAAIGIVIGSIGRLSVHLIKLYKHITFKKIKIEHQYKERIWQLTWPLLIGVSLSQISGIIDNVFASYMQEGTIASLSYAKKVVELPVAIFPYIISIVIFPYFAQLAIEKQKEKLEVLLADSLKWITIVFIPIAAFFVIFSVPIVEIIFQRGAFDTSSTALTSKPLAVYSLGLLFFAIETILVIFYYANGDTKTPVFIGIACVLLNILLTWVFIQYIGYLGIALAYVIQKTIKNLILLYLLKKKININKKQFFNFLTKTIFASIIFIALMIVSKAFLFDAFNHGRYVKMGFILINSIVIGSIYLLSLRMLGIIRAKNKVTSI